MRSNPIGHTIFINTEKNPYNQSQAQYDFFP